MAMRVQSVRRNEPQSLGLERVGLARIKFAANTVGAEEIRTTDEYGGIRVRFSASLGGAVIHAQADVGFGDAVTPASPESN